jgi:hypothetical protein
MIAAAEVAATEASWIADEAAFSPRKNRPSQTAVHTAHSAHATHDRTAVTCPRTVLFFS